MVRSLPLFLSPFAFEPTRFFFEIMGAEFTIVSSCGTGLSSVDGTTLWRFGDLSPK